MRFSSLARTERHGFSTNSTTQLVAIYRVRKAARFVVEALEGRQLLTSTWNVLGASGNWNSAGNFTPSGIPNSTSAIATFHVATTVPETITLGTNITVNSLTVGSTNAESETFASGNTLTFGGGSPTLTQSGTSPVTFACDIALASNMTISVPSGATLTISGNIDTAGHTLTFNGAGSLVVSGVISNSTGTGAVVDEGHGRLTLSASNTYSGNTTVTDSTLIVNGTTGYGNTSVTGTSTNPGILGGTGSAGNVSLSGTIVLDPSIGVTPLDDTTTLSVAGNTTLSIPSTVTSAVTLSPNSIVMAGTMTIACATGESLTLSGSILDTQGHSLIVDGAGSVNASCDIDNSTGNGTVTDEGNGTLTLAGDSYYTGTTTVTDSTLIVNGYNAYATGNISVSGTSTDPAVICGTGFTYSTISLSGYVALDPDLGTSALNAATLSLSGSPTLIVPSTVTSPGYIDNDLTLSGGNLTIECATGESLDFIGTINTNGHSLIANGAGSVSESGVISGSGAVTDEGGGSLTLAAANTYTGVTTITGSTLIIGYGSATGTHSLTVPSGSTLTGSGSISGAVTVASGGILIPGLGGGPGIIQTGNLTLSSGSNFDCVINGSYTAGTDYSQVDADGTVSISGANLNLSGSRTINAGDVVTLITGSSLTGTFSGISQGSQVTLNGVNYAASYLPGFGLPEFTLADDTIPATPSGLSATAGDEQVALNWTASDGAASYGVYEIESGSPVLIASPTTNSKTVTGLTDGTAYTFEVKAVDVAGASSYSSQVTSTPLPATPTGLTVAAGDTDAFLAWTPVASATSYNIYRNSGSGYVDIGSSTVAGYTDTGLTDSSAYGYEVTAVSGTAEGSACSSISVTPLATVFSDESATTISNTEIDLSWTFSGVGATYLEIDRSTDGINFAPITTTLSTAATTYNDTGLTENTVYYYRFRAIYSGTYSSFTDPVGASTLADVASLTATPASASEIDLGWTLNSSPEYLEIDRSTDGVTYSSITTTLSGSATSYADTGLSANTAYYYRIRAIFSSGPDSSFTNPAFSFTLPTPASSPAVTIVSPTQADISWTGDGVSTTQYAVSSSINGGSFTALTTLTNVETYVDTSLTAGETVQYKVVTTPVLGSPSTQTSGTTPVIYPDSATTAVEGVAFTFDLPYGGSSPSEWDIVWGDGNSNIVSASATPFSHTYSSAGADEITAAPYATCGAAGTSILSTVNVLEPSTITAIGTSPPTVVHVSKSQGIVTVLVTGYDASGGQVSPGDGLQVSGTGSANGATITSITPGAGNAGTESVIINVGAGGPPATGTITITVTGTIPLVTKTITVVWD